MFCSKAFHTKGAGYYLPGSLCHIIYFNAAAAG